MLFFKIYWKRGGTYVRMSSRSSDTKRNVDGPLVKRIGKELWTTEVNFQLLLLFRIIKTLVLGTILTQNLNNFGIRCFKRFLIRIWPHKWGHIVLCGPIWPTYSGTGDMITYNDIDSRMGPYIVQCGPDKEQHCSKGVATGTVTYKLTINSYS